MAWVVTPPTVVVEPSQGWDPTPTPISPAPRRGWQTMGPAQGAPTAFAGSGTLSATILQRSVRAVDFSGDGALAAALLQRQTSRVFFTGSGELGLDGFIGVCINAAFSGDGILKCLADAYAFAARDAEFSGDGALDAEAKLPYPDGLSAVVLARYLFQTAFAGTGSLAAAIQHIDSALAAFSGSGS